MTYDKEPTGERWQEIVQCQDEIIQGRKLREYVSSLQDRISELESELEESKKTRQDNIQLRNLILKSDIFKKWLEEHDRNIYHDCYADWSGLQGGI